MLIGMMAFAISSSNDPREDASVQEVTIPTPRGVALPASVHHPAGGAKYPVVVVAPGRGYHRGLPITQQICTLAASAGILAVRFDWAYMQSSGGPSAALQAEEQDLAAVLAWVRKHPCADAQRIAVAGKSLGSIVAWRATRADNTLHGLLLLTPVLSEQGSADRYYPGLATEPRPVALLVGQNDAANCPVPQLYRAVQSAGSNLAVIVVPGDHSLEVTQGLDEESRSRNLYNIEAAARVAVAWLRQVLAAPPPGAPSAG